MLSDLNPRLWLSPFGSRSIHHIVAMGLFYHVLGLALFNAGNRVAGYVVSEYAPSGLPVSIVSVLASGPIEESIFFGIPYLVFSSPYALLAVGSLWSLLHLFNASVFDPAGISYGAFLFTIPHIFFSIRTWTCGRGWVAIAFHSAWNLAVLLYACGAGAVTCRVFGEGDLFLKDMLLLVIAIAVSILVYISYKRKQGHLLPRAYYAASLSALILAAAALAASSLQLFP